MPFKFNLLIASAFSGGSFREIHTNDRDDSNRASSTSCGTPTTPESSRAARCSSAISAGTPKAEPTGTLIASGRPFRSQSARQILAMSEQLQVRQPPENRAHPQEGHAGDEEQTDVDAVLSHGEFR